MKAFMLAAISSVLALPCHAAAPQSDSGFQSQLGQGRRIILKETQSLKENIESARNARMNKSEPPKESEDYQRFINFSCGPISEEKDGGTIRAQGLISKSIAAEIHYDGKIGSATRGRFFAKTWPVMAPVVPPELPMTKLELKGLAVAVERYIKKPESPRRFDYKILLQHIRQTLSKEK